VRGQHRARDALKHGRKGARVEHGEAPPHQRERVGAAQRHARRGARLLPLGLELRLVPLEHAEGLGVGGAALGGKQRHHQRAAALEDLARLRGRRRPLGVRARARPRELLVALLLRLVLPPLQQRLLHDLRELVEAAVERQVRVVAPRVQRGAAGAGAARRLEARALLGRLRREARARGPGEDLAQPIDRRGPVVGAAGGEARGHEHGHDAQRRGARLRGHAVLHKEREHEGQRLRAVAREQLEIGRQHGADGGAAAGAAAAPGSGRGGPGGRRSCGAGGGGKHFRVEHSAQKCPPAENYGGHAGRCPACGAKRMGRKGVEMAALGNL